MKILMKHILNVDRLFSIQFRGATGKMAMDFPILHFLFEMQSDGNYGRVSAIGLGKLYHTTVFVLPGERRISI